MLSTRCSRVVSTTPKRYIKVHANSESDRVFYQGKYYTQEEWSQKLRDGDIDRVPSQQIDNRGIALAAEKTPTVGEVMNFNGAAPEITNARLAMLGFLAAVPAELISGVPAIQQAATAPVSVVITFAIFILATLIPVSQNVKNEAFGPFSPEAELLNGRLAMIGFAGLLILELVWGASPQL